MYTYWNNTENPLGLLRQHSGAAQNKTEQQLNKCTRNHCLCAALGREEIANVLLQNLLAADRTNVSRLFVFGDLNISLPSDFSI